MTDPLLLRIARCPIVTSCLNTADNTHPCAEIVRAQAAMGIPRHAHQVPEPWSGHIDRAPILFVSSNPSISTQDVYPIREWSDADLEDFFENRFGGGHKEWISGGIKALANDGTRMRATKFWAAVRRRAEELLQRSPIPGEDYALTEVVHCKSRSELGVRKALPMCVDRYLASVLTLSAACVVVVLGNQAALAIRSGLHLNESPLHGPAPYFGAERMIAFLPHPAAFGASKFETCVEPEELNQLRDYLSLAS